MRHFQQMVATPHQIDEGPAEERLVEIVGAAAAVTIVVGADAADTVVPVELAVVAHVPVPEGKGRSFHCLQQETLLDSP